MALRANLKSGAKVQYFFEIRKKNVHKGTFFLTARPTAISYIKDYFLLLNLRLAALVGSLLAMISWHASAVKVVASTPRGSL